MAKAGQAGGGVEYTNLQYLTQDMTDRLRKRRAAKTRFHIHRQTLTRKYSGVAKKAKKLTNARSRAKFYKKFESKSEAYTVRINFFEPRRKPPAIWHAPKSKYASYVHKLTPVKLTWDVVKHQIFSDSSSTANASNSTASADTGKNERHGLWEAAANPDNYNYTESSSDASTPWAAAADPAEYEGCDRIASDDDNNNSADIWAAPANPAEYADCSSNSGDSNNLDCDDSTISNFNPPEILGHHKSFTNSADPNATILEI